MAKKKDDKAILIAYYEDMKGYYGSMGEGHDGLVLWLMDYDSGERDFLCSNIFHTASGFESEEPTMMNFSLFKNAVEWHELHGYPIRWVDGKKLSGREEVRVRG